jgi:hypothetical protein
LTTRLSLLVSAQFERPFNRRVWLDDDSLSLNVKNRSASWRGDGIKFDSHQLCIFDGPLMNVENIGRAGFSIQAVSKLSAHSENAPARSSAGFEHGHVMTRL